MIEINIKLNEYDEVLELQELLSLGRMVSLLTSYVSSEYQEDLTMKDLERLDDTYEIVMAQIYEQTRKKNE